MSGDISKAVGYHITLPLLDQPKDLGEMAVNTGITDSHGGGSSIKDQASPPWWLLPNGKGNSCPDNLAKRLMPHHASSLAACQLRD